VAGALAEITIPANSEKEFSFTTNDLSIGDYNFFVIVEDENTLSVSNSVTFKIDDQQLPEEVFFAIIGIIVAVALFIGIYLFWKEAHN
jgi:hypothetical protein